MNHEGHEVHEEEVCCHAELAKHLALNLEARSFAALRMTVTALVLMN